MDVFDVTCWEDLDQAYWFLYKNRGKYKTVILDTLTQLQQMMVEAVIDAAGGPNSKFKDKAPGDYGTMTKSQWGDVSAKLKMAITKFRDLPDIETVFIAQDRVFNQEDDGTPQEGLTPECGPALSPATCSHLCASCSMVVHTFINMKETTKKNLKGQRKTSLTMDFSCRLGPNSSYITKTRKPKDVEVPATITNPTYDEIVRALKGS